VFRATSGAAPHDSPVIIAMPVEVCGKYAPESKTGNNVRWQYKVDKVTK